MGYQWEYWVLIGCILADFPAWRMHREGLQSRGRMKGWRRHLLESIWLRGACPHQDQRRRWLARKTEPDKQKLPLYKQPELPLLGYSPRGYLCNFAHVYCFFRTYFLHTNNAFNFFTILVSLLNSFSKEGKNRASSTSFSPWESKPLDKTTVLVHGAIIWHCNFNPTYTLKRTENVYSHKNLYMSTHSSIIKNVEEKQNIYHQIEEYIKVWHVRTMTYYSSIKRNTCYNMEKPWKCTRWKKPGIRPHIA